MEEKISLCGDNCLVCPRYLAQSAEECARAAELWYRIGWRDRIVSDEEIRCTGCSAEKQCAYQLIGCTQRHGVERCGRCAEYPCATIREMLKRSAEYREKCRQVCTDAEYEMLEKAFFEKERNLEKSN